MVKVTKSCANLIFYPYQNLQPPILLRVCFVVMKRMSCYLHQNHNLLPSLRLMHFLCHFLCAPLLFFFILLFIYFFPSFFFVLLFIYFFFLFFFFALVFIIFPFLVFRLHARSYSTAYIVWDHSAVSPLFCPSQPTLY